MNHHLTTRNPAARPASTDAVVRATIPARLDRLNRTPFHIKITKPITAVDIAGRDVPTESNAP